VTSPIERLAMAMADVDTISVFIIQYFSIVVVVVEDGGAVL
jgi:hypothetical protein